MRTLQQNTIVIEVETKTYQTVVCDLPLSMDAIYEDGDAFLVESAARGPNEQYLRADVALKQGLIFLSEVPSDRMIAVRLRAYTKSWAICDVPEHYLIGCDAGQLYLLGKNADEPQPQKWPVTSLITVAQGLANGLIQIRALPYNVKVVEGLL